MWSSAIRSDEISVVVNGEQRAVAAGTTVGSLLRSLGLDPRMVVVERNRSILHDRGEYDGIAVGSGDVLEIVHFVGGG
jgi:thiamine biosynthesis protein ThiS